MLWQHQRQLSFLEEEIGVSEREIAQRLDCAPFATAARLLYTAPGVGPVVAATVLAEIGDFHRFPDGKAIGRYAGLVPKLFNSGGKECHGHITKAGPPDLRWVMQQAAWTAIRCDKRIKEQWLKMSRGGGNKKAAAVGIARKLLVILWHMVTTNSEYRLADAEEKPAEAPGKSSARAQQKGPPLPPPPSPRPSPSEGEATAKAEGATGIS
jgi:transposase